MTKRVAVVVVLVLASAVAFADSRIVAPRDASLEALTAALERISPITTASYTPFLGLALARGH